MSTENPMPAAWADSSAKALICIPAYNEEQNVGPILDDIDALPGRARFDVLVVDDGSTDSTRVICEARSVMVISHIFNMGYGAALKTAYKYAAALDYEYIIQLDADGQHDVSNVDNILSALSGTNQPDIVIGSRFTKSDSDFRTPLHKRLAISFFQRLIVLGTGRRITDPTSGLQGLSRCAFTYYAQYDRFALDFPDANMIIQMALNRFSIEEIPAVMHPRAKGISMHAGTYKQFKYILKMVISVLIIYMRERRPREK